MKNAKRIVAVLLTAVLLASVFVGCNININVNYVSDETAAPTAAPATTAAPAPAAPETSAPATTAPQAEPASEGGEAAPSEAAPSEAAPSEAAPAPSSNPSTPAEVLEVYKEVYKNTKADGSFTGTSHMSCTSVVLEGKENGTLRSLADKFMGSDTPDLQLCPDSDDNPYKECDATVDDIVDATWKDNGDGTATINITPKETVNGMKFTSSTGKFFNVMEDVASALSSVPVISWSEGDANSNTTLNTKGTVDVTYDTSTMKIVKATYDLITVADVQHANVTLFRDKSATATFDYVVEYPG